MAQARGRGGQPQLRIDGELEGRLIGSPPPASLCCSCAFVRHVTGRHGRSYLLCRSTAIEAKYPRQPVTRCTAYDPGDDSATA